MNKTEERQILYIEKIGNKIIDGSGEVSVDDLNRLGFFTAPASTRYHGAYEGGLFDHSLATAEALLELTEKLDLKWERPESPYIVGMFHDLCKCDNYVKDFETDTYFLIRRSLSQVTAINRLLYYLNI